MSEDSCQQHFGIAIVDKEQAHSQQTQSHRRPSARRARANTLRSMHSLSGEHDFDPCHTYDDPDPTSQNLGASVSYRAILGCLKNLTRSGNSHVFDISGHISAKAWNFIEAKGEVSFYAKAVVTDTNRVALSFGGRAAASLGVDLGIFEAAGGVSGDLSMTVMSFHNVEEAAARLYQALFQANKQFKKRSGGHSLFHFDNSELPSTSGQDWDISESGSEKFITASLQFPGGSANATWTWARKKFTYMDPGMGYSVPSTQEHTLFNGQLWINNPLPFGPKQLGVGYRTDFSRTTGSPYDYENGIFDESEWRFSIPLTAATPAKTFGSPEKFWQWFETVGSIINGAVDAIESAQRSTGKKLPGAARRMRRPHLKSIRGKLLKSVFGSIDSGRRSNFLTVYLHSNFFGEGTNWNLEESNLMYRRLGIELELGADFVARSPVAEIGAGFSITSRSVLAEWLGSDTTSYVQRQFMYQRRAAGTKDETLLANGPLSYCNVGTTWHNFVERHKKDVLRLVVNCANPGHRYHEAMVEEAMANRNVGLDCIDDMSEQEVEEHLAHGLPALEKTWVQEDYAHSTILYDMSRLCEAVIEDDATTRWHLAHVLHFMYVPVRVEQKDNATVIIEILRRFRPDPFLLNYLFSEMPAYGANPNRLHNIMMDSPYAQEFASIVAENEFFQSEQECHENQAKLGYSKAIVDDRGLVRYKTVSVVDNIEAAKHALKVENYAEAWQQLGAAERASEAATLTQIGDLWFQSGNGSRAVEIMDRATEDATASELNVIGLHILHWRSQSGKIPDAAWQVAEQALVGALGKEPGALSAYIYNNLGCVYVEQFYLFGDNEVRAKAISALKKAADLGHGRAQQTVNDFMIAGPR